MHDSLAVGKKVMILMAMYNNSKRTTFEHQHIYENREAFHKAMKQLKKASLVKDIYLKRHIKEYKLTWSGIIAVEEVLKDIK